MTYRPSVVNRNIFDVIAKHYVIKFIDSTLKKTFRFYRLVSGVGLVFPFPQPHRNMDVLINDKTTEVSC